MSLSGAVIAGVVGTIAFSLVMIMGPRGMPRMHAGVKAGSTEAPGMLLLNSGMMGFVGGLLGHAIFGITVALVYRAFAA